MDDCDECGFRYDLTRATEAAAAITDGARLLADILRELGDAASNRSDPNLWSPLEYGCHLRDVCIVQRERALHAQWEMGPEVIPMGREERADFDGYLQQDADQVADHLQHSARSLAHVFSRLDEDGWERTLIYNYPEPAERSLRWLAVHTHHEVQHHLQDVRRS